MRRPSEERDAEVTALKALKPTGPFADRTAETIKTQIDAIQHGVDDTCDEWEDMSEEDQIAARDAEAWADGDSDTRPSEGFGCLVE